MLDEKTSAWGITTHAVEIRDIIIPKDLENAMSRQAQAERERLVFGVKVSFRDANAGEILKPGMTIEVSLPAAKP